MIEEQEALCARFNSNCEVPPPDSILGISPTVRAGLLPINGLRHPATERTSGWYIWAGEHLSDDPDFFESLHVAHLRESCPQIVKFLGLPPGWRFLKDGEYEDVWFDPTLLSV
jgi:hypothetical protein